ncbi:MAG: CinA family protein [Scrofimicrobium sp.]
MAGDAEETTRVATPKATTRLWEDSSLNVAAAGTTSTPMTPASSMTVQPSSADELLSRLGDSGLTLATAESLTGGLLSSAIVDIPGASRVFRGGVVSYVTDVKHLVLGVDQQLLDRGGPVQAEVATQMALGVARLVQASLGLATTGVAGPGDSEDGPQGLVYVAAVLCRKGEPPRKLVMEHRFNGSRSEIRAQTVKAALSIGLKLLKE